MTTTPLFPRSGVVLVTLAAAASNTSPAPIDGPCGHVIAVISTTDDTDNAVRLPEDMEIGALVEVFTATYGKGANVHAPTGETISSASSYSFGGMDGVAFRKISATAWRRVGSQ